MNPRVSQNDATNREATMPERGMLALAIIAFVLFIAAITAAFTSFPWFPLGG